MKKKTLVKIVSVLLALTVAFVPVISSFANSSEYIHDCPYIFVHGFMAGDIYADKDDPNSDVLWPPSTDSIMNLVKSAVPALLKFLVTRNYDKLFAEIQEPCKEMLCKANLTVDGEAAGNSGIHWTIPEKSTITKNSDLSFHYDWRLSPIEIAEQLNDFIEYVCDASGASKVCLEGHSFGGVVLMTYTKLYGTGRIQSICYNTTAIYGETYTGELFTGQITINSEALLNYLDGVLKGNDIHDLVMGLLKFLDKVKLVDAIVNLANKLVAHAPDYIFTDIVLPMFAGWLSIWAMVPDAYAEAANDYVFNQMYKDGGANHKGLVEKIDAYNDTIRPYRDEILESTNRDCNLYVLTRYNFGSLPMTPSWQEMSDTVIDTKFSSFGATCANYGEKLKPSYIFANKDNGYMSPDESIDASTCKFKDQTWFVKDYSHSWGDGFVDDMILKLLYTDGQATIRTYEEYPQYLIFDPEIGSGRIDG